ncbi:MAG: DUF5723 family protein [Cyclobacteriaceae bacterium]
MILKKAITFLFSLSLIISFATAQTSSAFFQLGNATFQNSFYNPSFIPEGKVFVGLPVLSGVHFNFNNKFDYSDIITKEESGNQINLNTFLNSLQRNNMVSTSTDISLLHLAYTTPTGFNFSVFANERIEVDFLYPKSLMKFAIDGNATLVGERLKIGHTRASATHFREMGIGASAIVPKFNMSVGLRLKYLQGFVNASTPHNLRADITTNNVDYSLTIDMQNATLRTSGVGIMQGEEGDLATHLISNQNRGAAMDLGLTMALNKYLTFSASLTDLGYISWKENIKNHTLGDTALTYSGVSLKNPKNLEQTIKDSLINKFKNRLTTNSDEYTTTLSPKLYTSISYKVPSGGDLVGSLGTRYINGQLKYMVGAGYRHSFGKFFIGSASVTRLPQQFLNVGAALAVKGGPAQLYLAVDQLVNYDATKFKAIDVRVGMNFIFGKRVKKDDKSAFDQKSARAKRAKRKATSDSFLGSKVKVKGQEDIYTIIDKQERRKRKDYLNSASEIPGGTSDLTNTSSEPIPKSKRRFRIRKSDPIPSGKSKVKNKRSDPIPNDKKKNKKKG